MKLIDCLVEADKKKLKSVGKKNKPPSKKRQQDTLTEAELKELMGVNRDTYRRGKGGAIRKR